MKTLQRLGLATIGILGLLAAIVAIRTATYGRTLGPDLRHVELAAAVPVDVERAARHLSAAVRIRTVSHQDPRENDRTEFERFLAWLAATYPAAHAAMSRELVADLTPVYAWPGKDPSLPPIVLMAHYDVVPVAPGTEGNWKYPPFEGAIAEGAVWGRGSIDDKGSLVALFEAIDALAAQGFAPRRTVMILSGHDEEAGGSGAHAVAELWRARGTRPLFALDEGLAVVTDPPVLGRPAALIGVAEKGYATLRVTAPAQGGHSSAPPPATGVAVLASAVLAIVSHPFELRFAGPGADMIRALAPGASTLVRMAVANEWLFRPLLTRQTAATPAGAAMLHTTIAPTMLRGSPKENVLPQDATAWINYRIAPGQTAADVMNRARAVTRGFGVELGWQGRAYDPPPVSSTDSASYRTIAALASDGGRLPVAPALVIGATDSRFLAGIARDVYRFQPIVASLGDLEMIHGTNEHLTLDNLRRMTDFYARLVATEAAR